jgi:hypothetical protein
MTKDRLIAIVAVAVAMGAIALPTRATRPTDCDQPQALNSFQRWNQEKYERTYGRNFFQAKDSVARRERYQRLGAAGEAWRKADEFRFGSAPNGYEDFGHPPSAAPDMPFSKPRTINPPPGVQLPTYTGGSGSGSAQMSAADRIRRNSHRRTY